ncbi:DUF1810 domain-containing protein [Lysobacter sp. A3-1-A15]|uniref:DUF1810 domain-containing protein n=1 Tax=Novilysobacter viscosus TaxID=3098602 RepID=UPI002EDAC005
MAASSSFELGRFVDAQRAAYATALAELRSGHKRSHWVWFVFPQLQGLGHSAMARRYALAGVEEARAYWAHPLLGLRLRECCQAVLESEQSVRSILGQPDDLKLRSCMTLFGIATNDGPFQQVLDERFEGRADPLTLQLLQGSAAD